MKTTDIETRMSKLKDKENELRSKYSDVEHITMHKMDMPHNIKTEKEEDYNSCIEKIYRLSHVARLPGCFDKHSEWENELQEMKEII